MRVVKLRLLLFILIIFAQVDFAQAQFHFGRNKIQYEDFDWQVLKTEHFDIHYYPEMKELAEHGAFFAEEVYKELENKFNYSLNHRVPIIFYSSNLHFKQTNTFPGFIPDGVGGFFEFLKGRVVIPANGEITRFKRVIRHELVHVFTFLKSFRTLKEYRIPLTQRIPLWFTEGLAEYWSGEPDYQHEMVLRDALFSNYFVPLESMFMIRGTFQMYKQGEAICRFISEEYGEEKILRIIDNIWKHKDFKKVMELTLHQDFDEIAAAWDVWVKSQYYPVLEEAVPPALASTPIAVRGFSSKPSYYEKEDGSRNVYYIGNRTGYTNLYHRTLDSLYRPISKEHAIIKGERDTRFESFHFFESRISISNDGRLAFVTKSGENNSIHIYDLEGDYLQGSFQFSDLMAIYSPTWSPDGERIAFSSIDRGGFSDLYIFTLESGVLEKLTDDIYDERDPAWSPDGNRIVFSSDRTGAGKDGAYNLFLFDVKERSIHYVTHGDHHDFSPHWSPDGNHVLFTSARKDSSGKYGAQDIWAIDMDQSVGVPPVVATTFSPTNRYWDQPLTTREAKRITSITTAAFDPVWTKDDQVIFSSFERRSFSIRTLSGIDSLITAPKDIVQHDLASTGSHWEYGKVEDGDGATSIPYKRKYSLDIAQGQVSQNHILGTYGGALVSFSDLMSNDRWYVTLYNLGRSRQDFIRSMNVAVNRVQFHKRANFNYGVFRHGGERYDITDPDASTAFPYVFETMYGGNAGISYPISMFKRVELSTSISTSHREIPHLGINRKAVLLSNAVSVVHDNTLYGLNGPMAGWRANLTAAYTTDIKYSNVNYYTFMADFRNYLRIGNQVTFASRAVGRMNRGREARLFILGGSWDLRGKRLYSVRGKNMWFTSHELRFPIMNYPSLLIPVLAPFGIASLRGALFFDAAHAWNDGYYDVNKVINVGETLGAAGLGFRMNLFGGFVLRYDLGYQYSNGFKTRSDKIFKQFFFGYDF
ncbi:MAG: BamA/TamA family outer membrane protein [Rhodothermales bacterium]